MPSITYWQRLEPRPRAPSLAESLAARVRDPLWMLTRQWQLGEFQGADAGSPAHVELAAQLSRMFAWRPHGGPIQPVPSGVPLEALAEAEPFTPDLSLRVELGQVFAGLLREGGAAEELLAAFREAYPLPAVSEDELAADPDQVRARFLRVCAGRAIDGVALWRAALEAAPKLPEQPAVPAALEEATLQALTTFVAWVAEVYGAPGTDDPPAWEPARLEYQLDVMAAAPRGDAVVLGAHPSGDGDFDWHSFDLQPNTTANVEVPHGAVEAIRRSVLPGAVRFRGMPNPRWWDFESSVTDFGALTLDRRDLAKLLVMDVMLVHGNDWLLVPFDQPVGTLCWVDALVVHDVFGELTLVERADAEPAPATERWTMFSTAVAGDETRGASFFLVPPGAAGAVETGVPLEEVRFLRDEMANMVWAIEHATENGIGQPWPGHERAVASAAALAAATSPEPPGDAAIPLRYRIQTTVPVHWIPFLPVAVAPGRRGVALERSAMLQPAASGPPRPIEPLGRILRPTSIGHAPYHLREEEVPRTGVRVMRVPCRSRWIDGSTHLWIARRKGAGAGEGTSGLRFDLADPAS